MDILFLITINGQINANENVTTVKRKVFFFNELYLILMYLFVPKMKKIEENMSSDIVIISALRVKFLK